MMRSLWLVLAVVFVCLTNAAAAPGLITTDPNTPEAGAAASVDAADTRLAQKVGYECKSKPTRELLDELTQMTGVAFISGKNRLDWQIRDAKMTIFVKDVPLAELMNSIARVMRFRWSRSGEGPNWSYRLVDDDEAVRKTTAKFDHIKQDMRKKRINVLKQIKATAGLSDDEVNKLKATNPYLHLLGKSGLAKAYVNLVRQVPGLEDAIIDQSDLFIPNSQLSPGARLAVQEIAKLSWKQISGNEQLPKYFADDLGQMDIQVKSHNDQTLASMNAGGYLGGFNVGKGENINYLGVSLEDPDDDNVMADNKQRAGRIAGEEVTLTPEEQKAVDSWENESFIEPLLPHPDLPELHRKVTVKLKGYRDDVIKDTAHQIKLNLVSDSYALSHRGRVMVAVENGEIVQVMDALTYRRDDFALYNWDKPSSIIEISDRNWYIQRQTEIPDAWIEKWRTAAKETGTLDLDHLAEIASLTEDQYYVIIARDEILNKSNFNSQIMRSRDYLKVYNTLSRSQRSTLLSKAGLSLSSLNESQQQSVYKIISGVNMPDDMPDLLVTGLDIRMTTSRIQTGRKYVYTFRGTINGIPLPGEYILSTPEYKITEKSGEKEQQ